MICSRRETLLSGMILASSLVGCTSSTNQQGSPDDSSPENRACHTNTPTELGSTPAAGYPRLEIVPDPHLTIWNVRFAASVLSSFTDHSPARIFVSFANLAEEERTFEFGAVVPFDQAWGRHVDVDAKMALFPEDQLDGSDTEVGVIDENEDGAFEAVPNEPVDGCWQAADEFHYAGEPQYFTLEPCERVSRTYLTFGHPHSTPCLPFGTYRFETEWKPESNDNWFTWGFEIHLIE